MSLLLPLGLLGLLGIGVLILIYLLKPNYQQKMVSSTYVWILSLKYKRKRIPINILRSLLILLCQILIITACALILAKPVIPSEVLNNANEKIVILDSSASMLSSYNQKTRFEYAVEQIKTLADDAFQNGYTVTVILADQEADYLDHGQQATAQTASELFGELDRLVDPDHFGCSFGEADLDGAMELAEETLSANPNAEVYLYTGKQFAGTGNINVVDVSSPPSAGGVRAEWNAAVLNVTPGMNENYCKFTIDVASYGNDTDLMVTCTVYGANADSINPAGKDPQVFRIPVRCSGDEVQTVVCDTFNEGNAVWTYESVCVSLDVGDSLQYDNTFWVYGGTKPTIRVQYYSTSSNIFYGGLAMTLRDQFRGLWNIHVDEVRKEEPALSGYDFYIFENTVPATLPTDGVVLLANPNKVPEGLNMTFDGTVTRPSDLEFFDLTPGLPHPITQYIADEWLKLVQVTSYTRVVEYEGYDPVIFCSGDPVLLVRNEGAEKIAVFTITPRLSTASVEIVFPIMMYNLFNFYFPTTLANSQYVYDVDDVVQLNARGASLDVSGGGEEVSLEKLPGEFQLGVPGTYTLTQTLLSHEKVIENIFVKIKSTESDLFHEYDALRNLQIVQSKSDIDYDLLVYFAAVLVGLLFVEWFLQAREQ